MTILKDIDKSIFNNVNVGIYRNTPGPQGRFLEANEALVKMAGYTDKARFLREVRPADMYLDSQQRKEFSQTLLRKGFVRQKEIILKQKDGSPFYAHVTATAVKDSKGRVRWFDGIIEDVSKVRKEQQRFKLIFEHSPIAIWEEDFSVFVRLTKQLERLGVRDIRKHLARHPDLVKRAFRGIKILDVNKAALVLYGAKSKHELIKNFGKTVALGSVKVLVNEFTALAGGAQSFESEFKSRTLDGRICDVLLRVSVPDSYQKTLSRVIVTIQDITERKRLEHRLKTAAQQDSLTKLLNSRAIAKRLEEELIRAKRYNLDLSCLMLDIDYFKVVNDKFGHQRGDQILKRVAMLIKTSLRRSDIIGRYGGDEFFVILTVTKPENARIAAERIRRLISALIFKFSKSSPAKITASIGVSGYPSPKIKEFRDLITEADKALYLAKASGRDCVILPSA
ncbi:MAG TPA: diguanylate cyclase [Candidatus Omnitrophota bacterium]|nr:diguanylate cyclase [Candidatus Omnitrophota bacterium]HPD85064.1 diguanylate cyclase [Candidatus Omnitrophota bacterium]HRZ03922.1 diguanylate cyclase [Candidatus Omnitrophota bacterium]